MAEPPDEPLNIAEIMAQHSAQSGTLRVTLWMLLLLVLCVIVILWV